jgi:hypothetical protein
VLGKVVSAVLLATIVAGCSDSPPSDPCLTMKVTVEAGVYGLVFQQCGDIGGKCPGKPYAGGPVAIYVTTSPGNPSMGSAVAETYSDEDGFYQLPGSGAVDLCVGVNPQCANAVSLGAPPVRWDYVDYDGLGSKWQQLTCSH